MNVLSHHPRFDTGNGLDQFFPNLRIQVVFFSEASFAPRIKISMNPPSIDKKAAGPGMHHDTTVLDASLRALSQRKRTSNRMPDLKMVEFSIELPEANTVKLAADFTDWEEFPLEMTRFENGVWSTIVPLPPGIYAYRFLADGERYDDPRTIRPESNDFGAGNAVVRVR